MQNNYTYHEFIEACEITGSTPTSWAEQNGLNRAVPTYLKQGVRPNPETLKKLISGWPRAELGLNILAAHLKDEIERAGVSLDDIEPVIKSEKPTLSTDKYLKVIAAFMNHAPIRESMQEMAHLLLLSDWAHENPRLTEELRAELGTGIDMEAVERGAEAMLQASGKKNKSETA